jgi:hypothetical protein
VSLNEQITYAESASYIDFVVKQIQQLGRKPPDVLWHYTGADAVINILKSGQIFSTQISCVNDATEYKYSIELVVVALNRLRPSYVSNADAIYLLDYIDARISMEASTSSWFITCFSTERDDLSQWRAYGGGENGFAIGFDPGQMALGANVQLGMLAPVQYDPADHTKISDAIARATIELFLDGWQRRHATCAIDNWASVFLSAWVNNIEYLAPVLKHSGFRAESEWRVIRRLGPDDCAKMIYLAKRTLLSRHLPISYCAHGTVADRKILPIKEIMVGPSRHREVSRVSVGDLLRTYGYDDSKVPVTVSDIPFQQV